MLDSKTLENIRTFAIAGDWDKAFAGTSRGNQHLLRMVKVAIFLAEQLKADKDIVEAAAWLHDFPLTNGKDDDYERNKDVADSVLDNFPLTEVEKSRISICIAAHEGTGDIPSLEAQIVHDADVLEKTGILGIIRHTWKVVHSSTSELESESSLASAVYEHLQWRANRLQTSLAKDIYNYLTTDVPMNYVFTEKLVKLIKPLATQHMITENIAKELEQSLTDVEYKKLQEQLSLSYLSLYQKS